MLAGNELFAIASGGLLIAGLALLELAWRGGAPGVRAVSAGWALIASSLLVWFLTHTWEIGLPLTLIYASFPAFLLVLRNRRVKRPARRRSASLAAEDEPSSETSAARIAGRILAAGPLSLATALSFSALFAGLYPGPFVNSAFMGSVLGTTLFGILSVWSMMDGKISRPLIWLSVSSAVMISVALALPA